MRKIFILGLICIFAVAFAACTPAENENEQTKPEEKAGLENGEFDLDHEGRNIHYRVHGKGPEVMVLTNSWGITTNGLRNVFKCMEDDFTMIYYDSRGMGGSSPITVAEDMSIKAVRDDFEIVRKHLGLEKVILMGWSNGAMNATPFLLEHPGSVSKAIMMHGGFYVDPADMHTMGERYPELVADFMKYMAVISDQEKTDEAKELYHSEFMLNNMFPEIFKDKEAGKELTRELFGEAKFSFKHNGYCQNVDLATFDMRDSLGEINVPVLVIAGTHDMIPPERLEAGAKAMANATYVLFEESAHFAMLEETEKFMKTIKEFLAE